MDPAFRLGPAPPSAIPESFVRRTAAAAWHASDGKKARRGERMRRQFSLRIDRLNVLARDPGKRIELQTEAIGLNYWNGRAQSPLIALTAIDPGSKRRQCALQRFYFTDPAAHIGIGEPQIALPIFAAQRLLKRLDRADVAQAQHFDQHIAIGQCLFKQPSSVE